MQSPSEVEEIFPGERVFAVERFYNHTSMSVKNLGCLHAYLVVWMEKTYACLTYEY